MEEFSNLLDLASRVASEAAQIICEDRERHKSIEQDSRRDVKIRADKVLDSAIANQLFEETPYPVLSEESGYFGEEKLHSDHRWIVDPLDGSMNFSRGIPINCISIGLWKGMEPILGVVYDFNRGELFSGVVGEGAWMNGKPIKPSEICEKSKAVLCTGFPVATDFLEKSLLHFVEHIKTYKKVRLLGSAALSLAYVSCGRADAYMENDIKIWDVAAGLALVKAAGGAIKYDTRSEKNTLRVKASNQHLTL